MRAKKNIIYNGRARTKITIAKHNQGHNTIGVNKVNRTNGVTLDLKTDYDEIVKTTEKNNTRPYTGALFKPASGLVNNSYNTTVDDLSHTFKTLKTK